MNSPIVKLLIVVALVLGGGYFLRTEYLRQKAEHAHILDLERIRREYLERAPLARGMTDPQRYIDEQRSLWKWYFNELTEHYNQHPEFKNYERFMDDLDARKAAKKVKEADYEQYAERYKITKSYWDAIRNGDYLPIYTALDQGLRFDIFKMEPIGGADPRLRIWVTLHGAQRKWNIESSGGRRVKTMVVNASFQSVLFVGYDEKDRQIVEMPGSGISMAIDHPERWIEEFPPGLVFGYYEIPLVPDVVKRAELTFTVGTRSVVSGEEVVGNFKWSPELRSEWKLAPGEEWKDAQEQIREDGTAAR